MGCVFSGPGVECPLQREAHVGAANSAVARKVARSIMPHDNLHTGPADSTFAFCC